MTVKSELFRLYRQRREQIADEIRMSGKDKRTYAAIGKAYGITRERVRQIAKLYGLERRKQANAE